MKLRIEFIIMKIFMKIVKICPKSPPVAYLAYLVGGGGGGGQAAASIHFSDWGGGGVG